MMTKLSKNKSVVAEWRGEYERRIHVDTYVVNYS